MTQSVQYRFLFREKVGNDLTGSSRSNFITCHNKNLVTDILKLVFWGIFPIFSTFNSVINRSHAKFQKFTHLSTSTTISPVVASLITVNRVFVSLMAFLHNGIRKNLRSHTYENSKITFYLTYLFLSMATYYLEINSKDFLFKSFSLLGDDLVTMKFCLDCYRKKTLVLDNCGQPAITRKFP